MSKIKNIKTTVYQWTGKTVPPQNNFCTNASDVLYEKSDAMGSFRFHEWLVCEIETDDGVIGIGNAALAPQVTKKTIEKPVYFPAKKELIKKTIKIPPKIKEEKIFKTIEKKKKKVKKKSGPSIYSKEYLEKKHGISLNHQKSNNKNISSEKTSFGFYNWVILFIVFIIALSKSLHFFQDFQFSL